MFTSVLLLIVCIGLGVVIVLLLKRQHTTDPTLIEWIRATQSDLKQLQHTLSESSSRSTRELTESMQTQTRDIHSRLMQATEVIGELKREAGSFSEVSRSMKDLHEFLKSPKLRGSIGEQVLNDLISQMFPKQQFILQHRFKTGSIVDAAIKTDAGILPIDSKFPMEHFQIMMKGETEAQRLVGQKAFVKDVKKHIDDIADKYILPEEGTMDFALMYVPSESVYYEIAMDEKLLEYARRQRVYPVSPTTLYAHLQTILLSFEGKKFESKSRDILKILRSIEQSYSQLEGNFSTLGKHITNAQNTYISTSQTFSSLGRNISSAKQLDMSDPELLQDTH